MKNLGELKKNHQVFVDTIQDNLKWVSDNITHNPITFSLDEIEIVQLFYEKTILNTENPEHLKQVFIAYMGEAFIKYFGGNWELSKMKNDEAYGTPIILNWGNDGEPHVRISPFVWTEIIRKHGGIDDGGIKQIFKSSIKRFNMDV